LGHHGNSRDDEEHHHRHFFNDFDFVAFGFPDWWCPGYGYVEGGYSDEDESSDEDAYNDSAPAYGDQYWQDLAMKVQWALYQRGYYEGPIDGVIDPDGTRAIRGFQEVQGLPTTGRIDPNVLAALKLPLP
jgi:putative peptidoglycan binding protein